MPDKPIMAILSETQIELVCDYRREALGAGVLVRAGFRFDGASIPRALWPLVGHPLQGDHVGAAIIHDALYASELVPRHEADAIFRALLRADGVSGFWSWAMWMGVRAFGGRVWRRHDGESVADARSLVVVSRH